MKCRLCDEKAVLELKAYNEAFCSSHFTEFFERRVSRTIRRYRMLSGKDRVLVLVSGGKDSLSLWEVLLLLGYKTEALHINLGITKQNYSQISEEKARHFARERGAKLHVIEIEKEYGFTIPEVKRRGQSYCSICGLVKRYIMNKVAYEKGFKVLATAHNLDDEVGVLLSNVLSWEIGYLGRQGPVLPSWHEKLVKKIKPFAELTEKETAAYAFLKKIDYIYADCPYSVGSTTLFYKEILNQIEERSPSTKLRFYRDFLRKAQSHFKAQRQPLFECPSCGFLTAVPPCAFCRLLSRLHKVKV